MLPFQHNRVVKLQVMGAVFVAALENGVSSDTEEVQPGRFPQGLRNSLCVRHQPRHGANHQYHDRWETTRRATYVYAGRQRRTWRWNSGDGYEVFRGATFLVRPEQAPVESDIFAKRLSSVPAIAPKTDGRIKRLMRRRSKIR